MNIRIASVKRTIANFLLIIKTTKKITKTIATRKVWGAVIEELAAEFEGRANICKVNTDEQQDLAVKFGIRSIPSILFFKDGEVVDQMVGAASKEAFAEKINALL